MLYTFELMGIGEGVAMTTTRGHVHPLGPGSRHGAHMSEIQWPDELGEWAPMIRLVTELVKHAPECWRLAKVTAQRRRRRRRGRGRHRAQP